MGAIGGLLGNQSNNMQGVTPVNYSNTGYDQGGGTYLNNLLAQNSGEFGALQSNANLLGAQNGIQNQGTVFGQQQALAQQQQALASQLQGVANGTGPNPAQQALNQQTGQNIQNQAALMGSQRGSSQNIGLMARQAAQQGAATQQQSVGQGATLQAQQQIAGMQALGAQQSAIGQQQANMGNLSSQQVNQQLSAQQAAASYGMTEQQAQQNAMEQQNAQQIQMQSSINAGNAQVGAAYAQAQGQLASQMVSSGGSAMGAMGAMMMSQGGSVEASPMYAEGGPVSKAGKFLNAKSGGKVPGKAQVGGDSMKNDNVHALLSPGEIVVPRTAAQDPHKAAAFAKSVAMRSRRD